MATATLALIILAAILAQIAIAWLIVHYRKRRQTRDPGKSADTVRPAAAPPALKFSANDSPATAPAWEGFREFIVQRREIEDDNEDVCSFYLAPTDGKPLPSFRPGQFLTFKLQVQNPVNRETKTIVRCYTISDRPRLETYRVTIKRLRAPLDHPELPPGLSSNYFHDQVREGSTLLVKTPSGYFHLMEDEPLPIVLIGGGIGITPMLCMLNAVLDAGIQREVWLYYGIRNGKEQIMKPRLQALAKSCPNFHLHLCYSALGEDDVEGVDYQHGEQISIPLLRSTLKLMRHQFYVCGPKPMMESLVPGLEEWGVDSGDIYYESFGPATLIRHDKTAPKTSDARSISVNFSRSGKSIAWNPAAESLLEFAESNNIEVDSGCRAGSCGSCQTAVEAGEVDYHQQPDADVEAGHCLLCVSTPKTDLTLTA